METLRLAENVSLRSAFADDVDWAAPLLFAAEPSLFSYIFAAPAAEAQSILQQAFTFPHHAFSYEHTQVVEVEGKPAGLLISYSGSTKRQADGKVHSVMARILPLRKLPKILVNLTDLTRIKQDVAAQDYYILTFSIAPAFRNQGLGSYLLHQAERQARAEACQILCLDVTYTNMRAKALLERHGYRTTCSKTSDRFEQMTRAGGIHRMTKSL
jgi:ribosomal protein S18 acetylase RimI-like enzyme